jgi:chorismate mutase/prephenate dehydratase
MDLSEIRVKLNEIDNRLLDIYNERLALVEKVAEYKHRTNTPIYRPDREYEILERLKKINREKNGILTDSAIEALFMELISVSRNFESAEYIAFLGPEGSFTHQAAEEKFGRLGNYVPISSISGIFREVASKKVKYGVVAIENGNEGIVGETINGLKKYDLKIVAEVVLSIHHSFVSTQEDLKKIKKVYSKDIAFDQCRVFLEDFGLDRVELIPVESTAKAAQLAKEEPDAAAICSEVAAKLYNVPIIFKKIEDSKDNKTRFFVISDSINEASGNDKTTILAQLPNRPGALVEFLLDFKESNIDLTKIKSHIIGGVSMFFLEFNGHYEDENIAKIFNKHKSSIKFLGSYVKESIDV